jgi:hypothetical protein
MKLLLLGAAPQDLPYSLALTARIVVVYLISGVVVQGGIVEPLSAISQMILSLTVTLAFTYVVLSALELKPRLVQTFAALVGVGIFFNLLAWPILLQYQEQTSADSIAGILSFFIIMLTSWELLVNAHIYRHALNVKMSQAIILSLGLFFMSYTLSQMIFQKG